MEHTLLHGGPAVFVQGNITQWRYVIMQVLVELQNSALNLMSLFCGGLAGFYNCVPDFWSDAFQDIVTKLHTLAPNESRICPFNFRI